MAVHVYSQSEMIAGIETYLGGRDDPDGDKVVLFDADTGASWYYAATDDQDTPDGILIVAGSGGNVYKLGYRFDAGNMAIIETAPWPWPLTVTGPSGSGEITLVSGVPTYTPDA